MPRAHTDGDSVVFFRRSDVVSAGDIFTPEHLSVHRSGSAAEACRVIIDALNRILELTVPAKYQEGGTYVIPGHGRLCEEADVVEYRDMVTIIRDRIAGSDQKGQDARAGEGGQTDARLRHAIRRRRRLDAGDMFVEAVYKSLARRSK